MDKKALSVLAIAVVAIAAVAGIAVYLVNNEGDREVGVTYYGNGGTTSDGKTSDIFSNSEAIECIFSYENRQFTEWNTKSDGSGTSYKVGDSVREGMSLYAQWSPEFYLLSISYSHIGGPAGINLSITDASGTATAQVTYGTFENIYLPCLISVTDGSGWTYDKNTGKFTGTVGESTFDLKFTSTGIENPVINVNDEDKPTFAFDSVSGSSYSLSIMLTLHTS